MHYDYLVVGAGLFGSTFAYEAELRGKSVLVIDKRDHIAGNIYTKDIDGIMVHYYGAHIFHTSDEHIWSYINQFGKFNNFINSPIANFHGELYHLPFNMNTFHEMWGVATPEEAKAIIEKQVKDAHITNPKNLEEQAISLVGTDVYHKLIKEYTEKQWGRDCKDLPSFIIKRLPLRFSYDNNYFNDKYQGIPVDGYTNIVKNMLKGIKVLLSTNYFDFIKQSKDTFGKTIYTGSIDEFYHYSLGLLEYRKVRFEIERLNIADYQGNAVINYTSKDVPYTRIIEHKHFVFQKSNNTVISKEFSSEWKKGDEPFYTVNDEANTALYNKYVELSKSTPNIIFGGRLGLYRYFDMDKVIIAALELVKKEFNE